MPQIRFRGIDREVVLKISRELVDNLENIIGCQRDYFILEVIDTTCIKDGLEIKLSPFVEVAWFDRGQEIRDRTALEITRAIKSVVNVDLDIAFTEYKKECYYENGVHF